MNTRQQRTTTGRRAARTRRTAVVVAASATALVLGAGPAMATTISSTSRGGHISGTVSMNANGGSWNLRVGDVAPDGGCVYGEIEPDVPNHTDPELHSQKACGNGTSIGWTGSYTRSKTRGFRIKICNDEPTPDECSEVAYVPTT